MPRAAPKNALELLRWGENQLKRGKVFFGHGTRNAYEEAVYLVYAVLNLPFDAPRTALCDPLAGERVAHIQSLFAKRIRERIPAAYLVNKAWFAGLEFYVDERVLIPRSPMAELIEQGFEPWVSQPQTQNILELGTGSGCIAIACAHAFPQAKVTATDISPAALTVAAINRERHPPAAQMELLQSDLFAQLSGRVFDVIVSNPPYVPAAEVAALPPEYQHEPALGLAAADDGLALVEVILHDAAAHLSAHGVLIIEVGDRASVFAQRYPNVPFMWFDFERGGDGVFMLTRRQLLMHFSPASA